MDITYGIKISLVSKSSVWDEVTKIWADRPLILGDWENSLNKVHTRRFS